MGAAVGAVLDQVQVQELAELEGGGLTLAFGGEVRREQQKFTPSALLLGNNVYGDRNLVCSCVGMEAYAETKN